MKGSHRFGVLVYDLKAWFPAFPSPMTGFWRGRLNQFCLCFVLTFIALLDLLCLKQRRFLMQKQALKSELCPSVRVTVAR